MESLETRVFACAFRTNGPKMNREKERIQILDKMLAGTVLVLVG